VAPGGDDELDQVLTGGARYAVERGYGVPGDLARCEDAGVVVDADPGQLSPRARERGLAQVVSLGAGNHFLEVQMVDRTYDPVVADAWGLRPSRVAVMIHCSSRGLGHQLCTDQVRSMQSAMGRYGITVPDRQLACVPVQTPEGRSYLGAMAAAANFAFANRHAMAHAIREAVRRILGADAAEGTLQVYDVAHNVAKFETYGGRELCVHRKGATRAFPAGSEEIPAEYRAVGQPVFIPGSMGTASFVLAGEPGSLERSFGTTCHGAGRRMSRTKARHEVTGAALRRELEGRGIVVRCPSNRGLAEEAPFAYKDVEQVVDVVQRAGLARRVARLRPLGVVKG
jgi:tRNA-splicing ligase RtcB